MRYKNLCMFCVHYQGHYFCAAFPDGISNAILTNHADHRHPLPGDHGIQFSLIPNLYEPFKGHDLPPWPPDYHFPTDEAHRSKGAADS
jgi:hypothetical protein